MKKYFLILFLLFAGHMPSISQATDSLKIDSLEKKILYLKDSAKVDCLNLLAQKLSITAGPGLISWSERADSVYHYASIAYQEANRIDYKKGIAAALTILADAEWLKGIDLRINKKDDAETLKGMENYLSRAIPLASQLQDHEILGYAYESWSDMENAKSKSRNADVQAEYFKKAIDQFHLAGNDHKEGEDCLYQGERYVERGYYDEAIEYLLRALELNKKSLPKVLTKEEKEYYDYLYQQSLADVAELYKTAGDYETAMSYIDQDFQFALANNTGWDLVEDKAELFRLLGKYDSSLYYFKKLRANGLDNKWVKLGIGATFLKTNQYDSALSWFQQVLPEFRKVDVNGKALIPVLLNVGGAYAGKSDYGTALPYVREGLSIASKLGTRPDVMTGYELLSRIHYHLGNPDSAYQYLLKYTILKDSIQNRQFIWRLNNYKKAAADAKREVQLSLLDKDNKLKTEQLKQQSLIRNFLIGGFLVILIAGVFIYRTITLKRKTEKLQREQLENKLKVQQLENEKKQAELKQQATELEMQALRAQMNPHFIFNCLSSINRFILKNESKTASNYLTRFSRLIRMVLMNSQKPLITLEEELQMLRLYLDMEQLRFKDSFDYTISFTNAMDAEAIFIPPLILQPFCENAIWHGLMHKEGPGHLTIDLSMQNNILHCIIADDGIGRQKAAQLESRSGEETRLPDGKEKSMGLKITTQRLALLNQEKNVHTFYTIEDITDENKNIAGTKVILKIGYKESIVEYA